MGDINSARSASWKITTAAHNYKEVKIAGGAN
jgi:hypothetical protein